MKATIGLEWIGAPEYNNLVERYTWPKWRRPWMAEITGMDRKYGLEREFVESKRDFSESNKKGSRGVMLWFVIDEESIYEVFRFRSWSRSERYFARWIDGAEIRMSEEEVEKWLLAQGRVRLSVAWGSMS